MSNIYQGPSIDAFYQVSVHLAEQFRRRFKKIVQSETRIVCGSHICWKHLWRVLSKNCSFCPNLLTNMAITGNSCFLIGRFLKIFSSETAWSNELSVVAMFVNGLG
jgi:hypothetical protein